MKLTHQLVMRDASGNVVYVRQSRTRRDIKSTALACLRVSAAIIMRGERPDNVPVTYKLERINRG